MRLVLSRESVNKVITDADVPVLLAGRTIMLSNNVFIKEEGGEFIAEGTGEGLERFCDTHNIEG